MLETRLRIELLVNFFTLLFTFAKSLFTIRTTTTTPPPRRTATTTRHPSHHHLYQHRRTGVRDARASRAPGMFLIVIFYSTNAYLRMDYAYELRRQGQKGREIGHLFVVFFFSVSLCFFFTRCQWLFTTRTTTITTITTSSHHHYHTPERARDTDASRICRFFFFLFN